MTKNYPLQLLFATFLLAQLPSAVAMEGMAGHDHTSQAATESAEAVGVVDAVDAAKGIVTITHEPVKSLGWPGMTMDFVVKDKKLQAKLTKGKKITFTFVQQRGDYVITQVK